MEMPQTTPEFLNRFKITVNAHLSLSDDGVFSFLYDRVTMYWRIEVATANRLGSRIVDLLTPLFPDNKFPDHRHMVLGQIQLRVNADKTITFRFPRFTRRWDMPYQTGYSLGQVLMHHPSAVVVNTKKQRIHKKSR